MMKTTRGFARTILLLFASVLAPALLSAATDAGGQFGSSAVWHAAAEQLGAVRKACDSTMTPTGQLACLVEQMKSAGAPADSISFTKALFGSKRQIGI